MPRTFHEMWQPPVAPPPIAESSRALGADDGGASPASPASACERPQRAGAAARPAPGVSARREALSRSPPRVRAGSSRIMGVLCSHSSAATRPPRRWLASARPPAHTHTQTHITRRERGGRVRRAALSLHARARTRSEGGGPVARAARGWGGVAGEKGGTGDVATRAAVGPLRACRGCAQQRGCGAPQSPARGRGAVAVPIASCAAGMVGPCHGDGS